MIVIRTLLVMSAGCVARKGIVMLLIGMIAGLGIAVGLAGCELVRNRHRVELRRIENWVREAKSAAKEPKADDEWARSEILTAIGIALGNYPLCYPNLAPTERVRELADYLDQTKGLDLKTLNGALRFLTRLEKVCPGGEQNGAVAAIRDLQRRGELPWPQEQKQSKR